MDRERSLKLKNQARSTIGKEVISLKVDVQLSQTYLDTEGGYTSGLELTCPRCGLTVEVYGDSMASAKAGAAMLRGDCPRGECNFYDVPEWFKLTAS